MGAGGASGGGGGGGVSWKLKKAAKKILAQTCGGSFSWTTSSTDSSSASGHNLHLHTRDVRPTAAATSTSTSTSNTANAAAIHVVKLSYSFHTSIPNFPVLPPRLLHSLLGLCLTVLRVLFPSLSAIFFIRDYNSEQNEDPDKSN